MADNSNTDTQTINKKINPENGESAQNNKSNEELENLKKKATLLFLQGKRSIFIRDYQAAVATLSESCQIFSEIYPEKDDALADPYFYYGKALLEVGRSESEVLGDQIQEPDGNDYDDDEEEEEAEEEEEEIPGSGRTDNKNDDTGPVEMKSESSAVDTDPQTTENQTSSESVNSIDNCKGKTDEDKIGSDDDNGDINDLQLSWEYLELAKLIYLRKAETCKETAIKLAETFLCLGENGLESENYSIAIGDIKQALELQQKHLSPEDRHIAETYYQLGMAHSLDQNYDEAISSFKNAIQQLGKKIESLETRKKMGDKKTPEEERDAFYTMDGEIIEIKGVIKDIEEKIKDMMDCKNQVKAELLKQVTSAGNQPSSSSDIPSSSVSSKPATDISHLIRKKRKNDEEEVSQEKKTKTDV